MLQTRPSSASGILQTSQNQSHLQYPPNASQMKRSSFHGMSNGMGVSNYRGQTSVAPIAPYAFTSTPSLSTASQRAQGGPHLRKEQRTYSAPIVPTFQQPEVENGSNRSRHPATASLSTTSTSSSSELSSLSHRSGSKDDSALPSSVARISTPAPRPHSTIITSATSSLSLPSTSAPVKPSLDRYRRPGNRRTESSTTNGQQSSPLPSSISSMPNFTSFYANAAQNPRPLKNSDKFSLQTQQFSDAPSSHTSIHGVTADDMLLNRQTQNQAKRYRRRSIHAIDANDYAHFRGDPISAGIYQQGSRQVHSAPGSSDRHPLRSSPMVAVRPTTAHGRNGNAESVNSARSSHNSRPSSVS